MTENEYIELSKLKGVREENIKEYLRIFYLIKEKSLPNIEFNEYLVDLALELQEREDNDSDEFVILD
jgi:hypothetical protein